MTTIRYVLQEARKRIAAPELWGKGIRTRDRAINTCCISEAIEESTPVGAEAERFHALRAVYNAAGLDFGTDYITEWNDDPKRTHREVIATLDLAIKLSEM